VRADQLLVDQGLASSRSQAQRLIASGVQWRWPGQAWRNIARNSDELPVGIELKLLDDAEARYVSRGGLKLEGALRESGLSMVGKTVLDVGQSTGGFTDCALKAGASRVVGVDVGHDQLHASLRGDDRVVCLQGVNARSLTPDALAEQIGRASPTFDVVVADVSFVSLTLVMPSIDAFMAAHTVAVLLVKPQFELSPDRIGKGGLVKNPADHDVVKRRVLEAAKALRWQVQHWLESPIAGGDGNREFFLIAQPSRSEG
jgi:23S rRNA (cytidine1920-2'-O)/16S rRNA (cytidine1409-2'-O)-methyltransferase